MAEEDAGEARQSDAGRRAFRCSRDRRKRVGLYRSRVHDVLSLHNASEPSEAARRPLALLRREVGYTLWSGSRPSSLEWHSSPSRRVD